MVSLDLEVVNALGLHVRACSKLVNCAHKFVATVVLHHNENRADCKRIIEVMSLGAAYGSKVRVEISGDDELAAAKALEALFADGFGEL